jgi:hypothetical protein
MELYLHSRCVALWCGQEHLDPLTFYGDNNKRNDRAGV